jgi:hypothetical protein
MPEPLAIFKYIETLIESTRNLSLAGKAKAIAYFYLPLLILFLVAYFGGGLSTDSSITVSELKTEINETGAQSSKRGLVVIADPTSLTPSEYIIPLAPNGAKVWSSFDENVGSRNKGKVTVNQDGLKINMPFSGESNPPVTIVVEGDMGKEIYAPGETVPVAKWGLSSRRSASLVYGVLIICSLALGLGVAVGFPPVKPDEDDGSQVGKEPDEKRVIERNTVDSPAGKVRVRPGSKTNRKKIPRIEQ